MTDSDLSAEQFAQLVGGGECYVHHHAKELLDFSDRLRLMQVEPVRVVTSDYSPSRSDELIEADTSGGSITVTLPLADRGREFQITKSASANVLYVAPTAPDKILGSATGVSVSNQWSSLHFKAVAGGYILV